MFVCGGETERKLNARFKEDHGSSLLVSHHVDYRRHSVDEESVSVLHQETDWLREGLAETIHIQQEAHTLNKGRERHTLPSIYQELLPATQRHSGSDCYPDVSNQ